MPPSLNSKVEENLSPGVLFPSKVEEQATTEELIRALQLERTLTDYVKANYEKLETQATTLSEESNILEHASLPARSTTRPTEADKIESKKQVACTEL